MSASLDGMCTDIIFDLESKRARFTIQDSLGKFSLCDYNYTDKLPLRKGDMIFCEGDYVAKIIAGEWYNVFDCKTLTARYQFDLLNFLIQYMPYMKVDDKNNLETVTQYYRNITDKISDYCRMMMGEYSVDKICQLFTGLYRCIEVGDDEELKKFAVYCFNSNNVKKIKNFFAIWNNDVLIRPLELLGLSIEEIKSIHIPLYEAYQIIKRNPYRLPQYSIEKASKIAMSHLRLDSEIIGSDTNHEELQTNSMKAIVCGSISRMIYDNVYKRNWSSTPVSKIIEKFPMYSLLKEDLFKYYFCIEEYEHVYFTQIYNIERSVANKLSFLIKKQDRIIREPVYPDLIPSEKQQEAIKGALKKSASLTHGGPGTGKTAIMAEMIRTINAMGEKVLCTSLTGAATTRMREVTEKAGVQDMVTIMTMNMAITVASKLIDMKIKYVIVDEISMINTGLLSQFISAFRTLDYQFIFIGDSNQLPPIEWGNVMCQLLKTPITKYHLTENFRSQKTIVKVCQDVIDPERINSQKTVNWNIPGEDYRFTIGDILVLEQWIKYYADSFQLNPDKSLEDNLKDFDDYRDKFTIICPYRKVVDQINPIFQKYFMSHVKEFTEIGGTRYYLGDRVMKLINDYGINVMNGEKGKVIKVAPNYIVCQFRGRKETITPYVEKTKFSAMKNFVKKNNIKFNPYNIAPDGTRTEKNKEDIKKEVDNLRRQYLGDISSNNQTVSIISGPETVNTDNGFKSMQDQNKGENSEIVSLFFSLLEEYPLALYNIAEEAEFLNIKNLCLAYAITTHKGQGSQYLYTIYFLNGKINPFVTVNNVYTGLSRAEILLHIITESIELLNSCCLNKQRFVYDKLYERINSKLPPEMVQAFEKENEPEILDYDDYSYEFTGEVDLADDYDLGY